MSAVEGGGAEAASLTRSCVSSCRLIHAKRINNTNLLFVVAEKMQCTTCEIEKLSQDEVECILPHCAALCRRHRNRTKEAVFKNHPASSLTAAADDL